MAQLEVRTSLCTPFHNPSRSGVKPGCSCGWSANVTYGSRDEANEAWRISHSLSGAAGYDVNQHGVFVRLHGPETVDPDRPRVDPHGEWIRVPPRSNPALRRGEEGVQQWPR